MSRPVVLLVKSASLSTKITGIVPPTGLLSLAGTLRRDLEAEVVVIDAHLERAPLGRVRRLVRELAPLAVGISALTAEAHLAHRLAAEVKALQSALPVVIGGPYPTSDPAAAVTDRNVDVAVIGEGEMTFLELLQLCAAEGPRWRTPDNLAAVRGIAFCGIDGQVESTPPRPFVEDLDQLPFPAWELIDLRPYWRRHGMASHGVRAYVPMFTSRGCPYRCRYCHQIFGRRFRARSPESVAAEAQRILAMGATDISILDDIANFDGRRFDRILETLLERRLHPALSFPNGVRADLLEEHSIELLKKVGVGEVSVAIETASKRLQKLLCKNLSLDRAQRAIDAMAARRILTRGFFMLGLPTETYAELVGTIRFAHASRLHLALFFTPNPFPGTGIHDMFRELGKLPDDLRTVDYEYYGSPFNGSEISDRLYRALYRYAYLGFYGNPRRIFRILRDRPQKSDLPQRAIGLLRNSLSFRRLAE